MKFKVVICQDDTSTVYMSLTGLLRLLKGWLKQGRSMTILVDSMTVLVDEDTKIVINNARVRKKNEEIITKNLA